MSQDKNKSDTLVDGYYTKMINHASMQLLNIKMTIKIYIAFTKMMIFGIAWNIEKCWLQNVVTENSVIVTTHFNNDLNLY